MIIPYIGEEHHRRWGSMFIEQQGEFGWKFMDSGSNDFSELFLSAIYNSMTALELWDKIYENTRNK